MDRICLIIDDNDLSDYSEEIARNLKKKGIPITFLKEFNVGSQERSDLEDENKHLDERKIIEAFEKEYLGKRIDLFAIDFDFEDEGEKFTGLDLIRIVRARYRNARIILHTAHLDKVLKKILEDYLNEEGSHKQILKRMTTLFKGGISEMVEKEKLEGAISRALKQPLSTDDILISEIEKLPNIPFKSEVISIKDKVVSPSELTPKYVLEQIQMGSNLGVEIKRELITRTLSYWIDYNSEDNA